MENEIHPAVDAVKIRDRKREAELAEYRRRGRVSRMRRRATLVLLARVAVAAVLFALICLIGQADWMPWGYSVCALMVVEAWLCLCVGAWLEFMRRKGGQPVWP